VCRVGSSLEGDCLGHLCVGCDLACRVIVWDICVQGDDHMATSAVQQESAPHGRVLRHVVTPMKVNISALRWGGASEGGHIGSLLATKPGVCYSCSVTHPVAGHQICQGWWSENRLVQQQLRHRTVTKCDIE